MRYDRSLGIRKKVVLFLLAYKYQKINLAYWKLGYQKLLLLVHHEWFNCLKQANFHLHPLRNAPPRRGLVWARLGRRASVCLRKVFLECQTSARPVLWILRKHSWWQTSFYMVHLFMVSLCFDFARHHELVEWSNHKGEHSKLPSPISFSGLSI